MPETTIDQKQLTEAIEKAEKGLVPFRGIVLTNASNAKPAYFHQLWSDALLNGQDNVAFEAFRESAKTQYVLRSFPLYALMFPAVRFDYIVLIKATAKLAHQKLIEIEEEYKSNPVLSANMVKINQESGDVFDIDVRDKAGNIINVRIEAYGKGSSIRGLANKDRRPRVCICDDLQDIEDMQSVTTLENDWNWFLSDIKFLGKHTRIFMIGNNLGDKCIIERIAANPAEVGFSFFKIPILLNDESQWPDMFPTEKILEEREQYRRIGKLDIWVRERMCLAMSPEDQVFHKDDFRYYTPSLAKKISSRHNRFMMIDPASSTAPSADYRSLNVVSCDHDNNWFILEISFGRWDTTKLIEEMFRLVVDWQLRDVGIEEGVLKSALEPFITKEMSKRNVFFNVVALKYRQRKEERIAALGPRYKAHTIFHPDDAPWLTELENELLAFTMKGTKGLHDDIIDALAYGEQIIKAPFRQGSSNYAHLPREAET